VHTAPSFVSGSSSEESHIHAGYVLGIAAAAALGGLLFGYDWVVIGGAKPFYEAYFHLSDWLGQ
jgi:SP family xylose:H+ symportor-like MFS transporter